ncbi:superoxide dismutase family protein [Lentisalinibacter sediminis]|uniref:superoxide dismutase family protein n=1 Tax=Lentisalinibacter sediminis TaxID=2992237 RepID=UPI00386CD131
MQTNLIRTHARSRLPTTALAAAILLVAGCGQGDQTVDVPTPDDTEADEQRAVPTMAPGMTEDDAGEPLLVARAELEPTEGNEARGTMTFSRAAGAVVIDGELMGLPQGLHGLHIHEKGDCSAPDATSAGGHFAPDGDPHGSPDSPPTQHHVGDLGNIEANEQGYALVNVVDAEMTLDDGPKSVLGRAVIVHAGADDFETQPTGAAGARLACGVITEVPRTDPPETQ